MRAAERFRVNRVADLWTLERVSGAGQENVVDEHTLDAASVSSNQENLLSVSKTTKQLLERVPIKRLLSSRNRQLSITTFDARVRSNHNGNLVRLERPQRILGRCRWNFNLSGGWIFRHDPDNSTTKQTWPPKKPATSSVESPQLAKPLGKIADRTLIFPQEIDHRVGGVGVAWMRLSVPAVLFENIGRGLV